jgi:hypothetical protein
VGEVFAGFREQAHEFSRVGLAGATPGASVLHKFVEALSPAAQFVEAHELRLHVAREARFPSCIFPS